MGDPLLEEILQIEAQVAAEAKLALALAVKALLWRDWRRDEHGWSLRRGGAHVWLVSRPGYCDRGRWACGVDGIRSIDDQDAFPRYFMNLDRAKLEMQDWLESRLQSEQRREQQNKRA